MNAKKPLVIFGTGDIARLAHFYFTRDSPRRVVGFTVDRAFRDSDHFLGLPLHDFEDIERRFPKEDFDLFIALAYARMNRLRAERYERARRLGYALASYISSRATVLTEAIGDNCFLLEDNTVQPFVTIGNDVTLWSGNHIGHDSTIGDHCFVSSHVVVSGHVTVGSYCFLGVNATLHNSIRLAPGTLVGAGAVITQDTVPDGVYVPPRARVLEKKSFDIEL